MRFIIIALATHRLTTLAIEDKVTEFIRDYLDEHIDDYPMLQYLSTCPWCVSMYAGAVVVLLEKVDPRINDVLAASSATGLLKTRIG